MLLVNTVSLLIYPVPLPKVPIIPVEVHNLPPLFTATYDVETTLYAALAAFVVAGIIFIIQTHKGIPDDDEWPGRNQEPITTALRRSQVSVRSKRPPVSGSDVSRDQQLLLPEGKQFISERRTVLRRYEEDTLPYRPRHPRGSALEAWARHLQTKAKD